MFSFRVNVLSQDIRYSDCLFWLASITETSFEIMVLISNNIHFNVLTHARTLSPVW